jgi:hypothetical protein
MNCPLEAQENAEQLLDYCARKLDPESTAILERHIAICPACREFAGNQRAVWEAMDAWEAQPVAPDFNRKLYARIERQTSWWDMLARPFRPLTQRWGVSAAAAACLILVAGAIVDRRPTAPVPANDTPQVEQVQAEQVEHALDAMDMLAELSRNVKSSAAKM